LLDQQHIAQLFIYQTDITDIFK